MLASIKRICKSIMLRCSNAMASVRTCVYSFYTPVRDTMGSLATHYGNLMWNRHLVRVVEGCGWVAGLLVWGDQHTHRVHRRAAIMMTYKKPIIAGFFILLVVINSVAIVGSLCFTGSVLFEMYKKVKPRKSLAMRACEGVAEGSLAMVHLGPTKALKLRRHCKVVKSAPGFYIKVFIIRYAMAALEDMCVSTIFPLLLGFVLTASLCRRYRELRLQVK